MTVKVIGRAAHFQVSPLSHHAGDYQMKVIAEHHYHRLGTLVLPLCEEVKKDREAMLLLYSAFDPNRDARLTSFVKLINVFNSLLLASVFARNSIASGSWKETLGAEEFSIWVQEYDGFLKIGFVQAVFLAIESSLRIFLRALDPMACKGGMAEFKSIYECLFKSKLSGCPADGFELLDLLRNIRNTVHNNGVFFNLKRSDASVKWAGQTYVFKHGIPVDFVTWDLIIHAADAVRKLLRSVCEDANIQAITTEITEPYRP
ncbi:MAG: hypothetical protein ACFFDI_27820 [Promethearchaeota archaeon]